MKDCVPINVYNTIAPCIDIPSCITKKPTGASQTEMSLTLTDLPSHMTGDFNPFWTG